MALKNAMFRIILAALLALTAMLSPAQTTVNLANQSKNVDFRNAQFTRPVQLGTSLPGTCTVGDMFLISASAAAGRNLFACMTANTWSSIGGELASQTDAEAGLLDTRLMTPLKTAQAIASQCALPAQAGSGGATLTTDGSVATWSRHQAHPPASATAITAATQSISPGRFYVQVTPSSTLTLTSAPTIPSGSDGQFLVITNTSTSSSLTLQDETILAGSNLRLGGANLTLAPRQSLYLVFNTALGDWIRADVGGSSGGGGGAAPSVQMVRYQAAKCQNTVPGSPFSLPQINGPSPICDTGANTLFGALQFTANGQSVQDAFALPPAFSSLSAIITSRTASTSGNSVWTIESACVGAGETMGTATAGGPSFTNSNDITLAAAGAAKANSISAETTIGVTGCAANELFMFRLSRNASTTTSNPELVSVNFKVQ